MGAITVEPGDPLITPHPSPLDSAGRSQVGRVLVVDDDRAVRTALLVNLQKAGWEVVLATSGEDAFQVLREQPVDVVLTDVMMPGMPGIELLYQVRKHWPETRVLVMTGQGLVQDAVAAMKAGADDYIIKPIPKDELLVILRRALREKALRAEVVQLRAELDSRFGFDNLVGVTPAMQEVYELVAAVAESDALVLLTGPTGTGKELLAHALHRRSPAARHPSFGSTALPYPKAFWRASCSATRRARSPARCASTWAASSRPRAARSSSTRSATFH